VPPQSLGGRHGILKLGSATAGVGAETAFAGWKASGVGPAEHGSGDFEFYTRAQAVYVEDAPAPTVEPG